MDVLGSVKNRLKTMRIINRNKKLKLKKQNEIIKQKEKVIISKKKIEQEVIVSNYNKKINFTLRKIEVSIPSVIIKKKKSTHYEVMSTRKSGKYRLNKDKIKNQEIKIDIQNENKSIVLNDESTKIKENFKLFVKDSKKEINKLKKDIEKEEKNINKIKTQKELEEYQIRLEKIKTRITYLKELYNGILNKYEFFGFEEINDFLLAKYIDDFKFNNSISEVDLLVENCKNEITYLEEINKLVEKFDKITIKEENKKSKINYLNNDYYNRMIDYNKLLYQENKINRYIEKETEYLNNLEKEINNNTLDIVKKSRLIFNKDYVNNLYKLNIGLSLFNTTFIGAFIGAFLVKNSLSSLLLKAFDKEEIVKYNYKYNEYISKITDNLSIVRQTNFLLNDSLKDINSLKSHMEIEYKEYLETKQYKELYNKLISLEKKLIVKHQQNLKLEENLLEQKRKNNEKQKKLEDFYK